MSDITPLGVLLPSHRKVAAELSDDDLETLLRAGLEESSPGYCLALLMEYERRNERDGIA